MPASSIERSLKEGLIQPTRVTEMLQTQDWLSTESFYKKKETFSPQKSEVSADKGEPFERFPRMFSESPMRGFRRGYYAPWTRSNFELNQYLTPTDNKSVKQLMREGAYLGRNEQESVSETASQNQTTLR